MTLSDKKGVQQIITSLAAWQVEDVVICPGSRNAPFIVSFNRHENFNCISIRDERSAAFFALGKVIELNKPVVLLCTSGSAPLNFAPAISEAYYQRIPLIIITADRPQEWIDQGDGQTINQTNMYQNYIRKSYQLNGDANTESALWYIRRCISEGLLIATNKNKGPIHFNIQLKEPLYNTESIDFISQQIFTEAVIEKKLSAISLEYFTKHFNSTTKIMLLVGQHHKDILLENLLKKIATFDNVIILTESTSNMNDENFIAHIDRCITGLNQEEAKQFMPDLLITLGNAIVSKRIKSLLRNHPPKQHWNIHLFDATMDTYQSLTHAIALEPLSFLQQIEPHITSIKADYRKNWIQLNNKIHQRHIAFSHEVAFSDFFVFDTIFKAIPNHYHLHISNSSPIRYAQLFDYSHISYTWCNRGTSGIDGCTSTAFGAAATSPNKSFLLITGDVSFQYDKNAFWNDAPIHNIKVIIINNSGGGIFKIIEGSNKIEECAEFLETTMKSNATHIAAQHNWHYLQATNAQNLASALKDFFETDKQTILEVFTDAAINPKILEQYWHYLKEPA
ncbi:MAG: 2-succinyl-5-enolpyruvyl-6-hydroxy-3-cyclohexene-1-carboxylic-acid synthase [Chitinophagaceae bacterium]|nr:2-succinyl-5-enolpyruvyl-6-hydroxy-3-cyclohexene-1-carboxylic-acid synthase [Chitinophagaceae bacterium]MCW5905176.1 2-succinyl-5-enolpyruvyl-6-hydroxy-3-cyclohexene-1-carboxylic-acid synthase [Chitinophagaceae bacterium]